MEQTHKCFSALRSATNATVAGSYANQCNLARQTPPAAQSMSPPISPAAGSPRSRRFQLWPASPPNFAQRRSAGRRAISSKFTATVSAADPTKITVKIGGASATVQRAENVYVHRAVSRFGLDISFPARAHHPANTGRNRGEGRRRHHLARRFYHLFESVSIFAEREFLRQALLR